MANRYAGFWEGPRSNNIYYVAPDCQVDYRTYKNKAEGKIPVFNLRTGRHQSINLQDFFRFNSLDIETVREIRGYFPLIERSPVKYETRLGRLLAEAERRVKEDPGAPSRLLRLEKRGAIPRSGFPVKGITSWGHPEIPAVRRRG